MSTPDRVGPESLREYSVDSLAADLGLTQRRLAHLAARIGKHGYSQFPLHGDSKTRVISAPRPWLSGIQRGLVDTVFARLPVANCVYSQRGRDVVLNAEQHLNHDYMAVMDVCDCFPSTTYVMVRDAFDRMGFVPAVAGLLTRMVTLNGRLPQGPPSSPAVLNCVLGPIDADLSTIAENHGAVYTRYMDDLCFSGNEALSGLRRLVSRRLRSSGYSLAERKTKLFGPSDRHTVTKIVVSSSLQPEPEYLKQLASALRDYHRTRSSRSRASIVGRIQWVKRLNPELGASLERDLVARHSSRGGRQPSSAKRKLATLS